MLITEYDPERIKTILDELVSLSEDFIYADYIRKELDATFQFLVDRLDAIQ